MGQMSGHGCGKPASDFDVPRDDDCQRPTSLVSAIARAVEENHGITITVNTVILGVCRDFWPSPWFCVTAVIFDQFCLKSAQ